MTAFLQIDNQILTAEEVTIKLSNSQLLPKFLQEIIVEKAIEPYTCTPEEVETLCENFFAGCSDEENQAWLDENALTREQVAQKLERKARLEKFKEATWGETVESYFFQERKHQLDQVVYSIICHQDYYVIQELYFRIAAKEQSFSAIASQYSQSSEAKTKGVVGPVEIGQVPTKIANLLTSHQPQQIVTTEIGNYYALIKLELLILASFDQSMRQRMIGELFDQWLQNEVWNVQVKTGIINI